MRRRRKDGSKYMAPNFLWVRLRRRLGLGPLSGPIRGRETRKSQSCLWQFNPIPSMNHATLSPRSSLRVRPLLSWCLLAAASLMLRTSGMAQTDLTIYDDALENGWQNWSWATTNLSNTAPVHSGTYSIAVTASPYSALYVEHDAIDTHGYASFTFWINGGATGGQVLKASGLLNGSATSSTVAIGPLAANTWQQVTIPLSTLGVADQTDLTGFWIQENAGVSPPTFFVDDMTLTASPPPPVVNVTLDATTDVRQVDARMFGMNAAIWDSAFDTPTTSGLLTEMRNKTLRYPGGSISDTYHWQTDLTNGSTYVWPTNFDAFASIATQTKAQVFITVNYGTGTPQEATDWVQYSNRTKKYDFKYWEIGNENYGTWEADNNVRPNDPVTYATRFKDYYTQMKAIDHSIRIGAVVVTGEDSQANYPDESATNPRTGIVHHGWVPVMLSTMNSLGVLPDFVIYHRYVQAPGQEDDTYLLTSSGTWSSDAADLRQMLNDYLGTAAAAGVELTCTENNSVYSNPGKQTTSLVNGLFLADSLSNLMKTEFNSLIWWDLRNGQDASNNDSPSLYGWRQYGDYGVVDSAVPAEPADRYPTFYVFKLLQHFARAGDHVLNATSDYIGLGAYAVRGDDGTLNLLLINKHPTAALNVSVTLTGAKGKGNSKVYSYGIPQDDAARTGVGSADIATSKVDLDGQQFTYSTGPYSATVLRLHGDD
jgi:alpha-N-arabinofuranosidase